MRTVFGGKDTPKSETGAEILADAERTCGGDRHMTALGIRGKHWELPENVLLVLSWNPQGLPVPGSQT